MPTARVASRPPRCSTAGFGIASFGLDEALDAYVADYGGGDLYRFQD
jgi:hypothetical protein